MQYYFYIYIYISLICFLVIAKSNYNIVINVADNSEEFERQFSRIISKAYHSPTGLSTPYEI